MADFGYIKSNFDALTEEIEALSSAQGHSVKLVAVTKSGSDEELMALCSFGAAAIGENRPGELKRRGELLSAGGLRPELHQIGNLQRNKVKMIIGTVDLIHSVDNLSLALEISKQAGAIGRVVDVLIEVNSAREEQKDGVLPEAAEELLLKVRELPSLRVRGLMTMGPVCDDAEELRPYFRLTKELFDRLNRAYDLDMDVLSMGMSDSYAVAIEEGATLVRVGRKLFNA